MGSATLRVDTAGVEQTGSTAVATLHWTWDLTLGDVGVRRRGRAEVRRRRLAGGLGAVGRRAVARRGREPRRLVGPGRPRRHPRRRRPAAGHRAPGVPGRHRQAQLDGRDPAASARALAQLVGIDAGPYVKAVKAAGRAGVRRGDRRSARRSCRPRSSNGITAIPGGRIVAADLPLAPTRDFAAPLLGRVGEVTAEIIEEHPEYHPGDMAGLSGLQARYDEQLRGTPGVIGGRGARDRATRASCTAPRRRPATRSCSPSTSASRPRPRSCSPTSARPARWWRSGPAPARSSPPRTARAPVARTSRRSASPRPGRRSRP